MSWQSKSLPADTLTDDMQSSFTIRPLPPPLIIAPIRPTPNDWLAQQGTKDRKLTVTSFLDEVLSIQML